MAYQLWEAHRPGQFGRAVAGVGIALLPYASVHDPDQRHWHTETRIYVAPIVHMDLTSSGGVFVPQDGWSYIT